MNVHDYFKYKKRIIIKIGSSSLQHPNTGEMDIIKMEKLARELCDLRNQGRDVCLVSSGAIAVGRKVIGLQGRPKDVATKQACAAVGQARLMMIYQRLFNEYSQVTSQILMTKNTVTKDLTRENAKNCFEELFRLGTVPIVNENDTISTYEMHFGDNDTLSAIVASLTNADLLVLLSDIDGLYTDDPRKNPDATLIERIDKLDEDYLKMAKDSTGSDMGTGGMSTKLKAAQIATASGIDMVIANGGDVGVLHEIMDGEFRGTFFKGNKDDNFDLNQYILHHI
ncbi:MAG TPA: glutamate 5-kinase [Candidatus Eubacterium avistercoris]|uniref:Glutamate 5-kinase n=1 Tax=Candidatus Eubacterium avistercoris TaxID=2838567 RepID=A0A9D2IEM7_9FIRM|nr:glutamate 5-kinase [Candidatus Eubacterium avistercoris]